MRVEQVALPLARQINRHPRMAPLLDRLLVPYNPFNRAHNANPYPAYEALRERGPIVWNRGLNAWMVSSFELCEQVLRSNNSVDRGDLFDVVPPWSKLSGADRATFTQSLLLLDPPDHTRLRKLVSRAFTPRTVERIEPRIAEIARRLIDEVRDDEEVDLFRSVFAPLPIFVIGELLGIPEEDWPRLKGWSDEFAKVIDPIDAFEPAVMAASLAEARDALDGWIEVRTAEPGEDLLTKLLQAEEDGVSLSRQELQAMIALLMAAGHETTSGLLGNAVLALADRPDLWRRLATDPDVVPAAVEELIRFDSAVQNTDRIVIEDHEVGGARVKRGQTLFVAIGAANRDPGRFTDPDRLDFDREATSSLSFGHGIHHCLGAALARQEMRIALPLVCEAFADRRVRWSGVEWKRSMTLRGPVRLPLVRR